MNLGEVEHIYIWTSILSKYETASGKFRYLVFIARTHPVRTAANFNSPQPHVHDMTDV